MLQTRLEKNGKGGWLLVRAGDGYCVGEFTPSLDAEGKLTGGEVYIWEPDTVKELNSVKHEKPTTRKSVMAEHRGLHKAAKRGKLERGPDGRFVVVWETGLNIEKRRS